MVRVLHDSLLVFVVKGYGIHTKPSYDSEKFLQDLWNASDRMALTLANAIWASTPNP